MPVDERVNALFVICEYVWFNINKKIKYSIPRYNLITNIDLLTDPWHKR